MKYIILLGTDTEWSYPFKKERVNDYIANNSEGNQIMITHQENLAMYFQTSEEADKFLKNEAVTRMVEYSKKILKKQGWNPKIIEYPL